MFSRYLYSKIMENLSSPSVSLILGKSETDFLESNGIKYVKKIINGITYCLVNPNDFKSLLCY